MTQQMCGKRKRDRRCYFYCRDYHWCVEADRRLEKKTQKTANQPKEDTGS